MSAGRLPSGVDRLIHLTVPAGWRREAALGDLAELAAADPSRRGRSMVWRAACGIAAHYLWYRATRRWLANDSLPGDSDMASVLRDVRHALRALRRSPAFSIAAVLTLAVGITAAVMVFAALEAAVLRPLPFLDPDRLVIGRTVVGEHLNFTSSAQDYADLRDGVAGFTGLAAMTPFTATAAVRGNAGTEPIEIASMSANLLQVLGVTPILGRGFTAEESTLGGPEAVIVSHRTWRTRFDGRREVIGESLSIDGTSATIVGVLPAEFHFLVRADAFAPLRMGAGWARARRFHNWMMVGRIADGVTLEGVQSQVDAVASRLQELYPDSNTDKGFRIEPLQGLRAEVTAGPLQMLVGAAALLLLLAIVNVGGLFLVRGTARRQEMAVRAALGAPRLHLGRQLALEGMAIALGASLLGLTAAALGSGLILQVLPAETLGIEALTPNATVVTFAVGVSLVASVLFGLIPGLRASRISPARELVGARLTQSAGAVRFRTGIVVLQLALSVVLLAGAGLLARTLAALNADDLGFRTDSVFAMAIRLPASGSDAEARVRFFDTLLERTAAIPGVVQAGAISQLPVRDPGNNIAVWSPDGPDIDEASRPLAYFRVVTPGYFETMGVELAAGRFPDDGDREGAAPAVVINRSLATLLYGDAGAVGRSLMVDAGLSTPLQVVGVVDDVLVNGPGTEAEPVFYLPYAQRPTTGMRLVMQMSGPVAGLGDALRKILAELDAGVAVNEVERMQDLVAAAVARPRVMASALGIFAGAAILLAAIGLYGVLAQTILQQRHDIGVRMALGADRAGIVRRVLASGARLALAGLMIGMAGALAAGSLIDGLLYGVAPTDAATLLGVAALLGLVALVASALPAWRAAVTDPVIALRSD